LDTCTIGNKGKKSWATPGSFTFLWIHDLLKTTAAFFHAAGLTGVVMHGSFPHTFFETTVSLIRGQQ